MHRLCFNPSAGLGELVTRQVAGLMTTSAKADSIQTGLTMFAVWDQEYGLADRLTRDWSSRLLL